MLQGRSATSLQWGAWGGTGMAVAHNLLPRIIKSGLGVLPPAAGLAALAAVLRARAAPPAIHCVAVRVAQTDGWRRPHLPGEGASSSQLLLSLQNLVICQIGQGASSETSCM